MLRMIVSGVKIFLPFARSRVYVFSGRYSVSQELMVRSGTSRWKRLRRLSWVLVMGWPRLNVETVSRISRSGYVLFFPGAPVKDADTQCNDKPAAFGSGFGVCPS